MGDPSAEANRINQWRGPAVGGRRGRDCADQGLAAREARVRRDHRTGAVAEVLSGWQLLPDRGNFLAMAPAPNPYRGFRDPAEVIQHAVRLYHCFSLSLRDVETIPAARGVVVSYETIRE